jgi:hypothetical protein
MKEKPSDTPSIASYKLNLPAMSLRDGVSKNQNHVPVFFPDLRSNVPRQELEIKLRSQQQEITTM